MMTNPKLYLRPNTFDELQDALPRHPGAFPLAGGALILGTLDLPYETIIDVSAVAELQKLEHTEDGLHLGGAVKLQQIIAMDALPPALKRAITRTLPRNLRNNTSVMETLALSQPPLEWAAALVALDATATYLLPEGNTNQVTLAESIWVAGEPHGPRLDVGVLTALQLPLPSGRAALGSAYIARTPAGMPIINAAVCVELDEQGNVSHAFAALAGASGAHLIEGLPLGDLYRQPLTPESIRDQAGQVPYVVQPASNYLGSATYRKQMAAVVVRRALEDAAAQLNVNEA